MNFLVNPRRGDRPAPPQSADALIVALVGLAVYLFFLSVGSVEYDNGIQAQQLETAYTELKAYSDGRPECQWLDRASRPLVGVMPDLQCEQASIRLQPGDLIAFVTDGITEARDRYGEMFGRRRLLEVAGSTPSRGANHLCLRVNQAMVDFMEDLPQIVKILSEIEPDGEGDGS